VVSAERGRGAESPPSPSAHAAGDAAQGTLGLLGCQLTLPGPGQLLIPQHPQVLLGRAALHPFIPQPVLVPGVAPTQVQDLALGGQTALPHVSFETKPPQPTSCPIWTRGDRKKRRQEFLAASTGPGTPNRLCPLHTWPGCQIQSAFCVSPCRSPCLLLEVPDWRVCIFHYRSGYRSICTSDSKRYAATGCCYFTVCQRTP